MQSKLPTKERDCSIGLKIISLLLAISVLFPNTALFSYASTTNYHEFNGHTYRVFSSGTTSSWEEAKNYCENLGGHLAVISSAEENAFLSDLIHSLYIKTAYFGYTDSAKEGHWQWVTDEENTYTNWHSGEPNGESSDEDYAEFYWKWSDGTWNDGNFAKGTVSDGNSFICEWDYTGLSDEPEIDEPQNGTCGESLTWRYENGTLYIEGSGEMDQYANNKRAPWFTLRKKIEHVIIGEGVTSIGYGAFRGLNDQDEFAIPEGVTYIGPDAFLMTYIDKLYLPHSLELIKTDAFISKKYLLSGSAMVPTIGSIKPIRHVYYYGTEEEWNQILISDGNEDRLKDAEFHYLGYQEPETPHIENHFRSITVQGCYLLGEEHDRTKNTEACINDTNTFLACMKNNRLDDYVVNADDQHIFRFSDEKGIGDLFSYMEDLFHGTTTPNDMTVFYYSGHATNVEKDGKSYHGLLPDNPDNIFIPWKYLAQKLCELIQGKIIVILDCCFSESFIKMGVNSLTNETDRNRISVLAAASENQFSQGGNVVRDPIFGFMDRWKTTHQSLNYGKFTYNIAHGLGFFSGYNLADKDINKKVTLDELYNYVSSRLFLDLQTPHVYNGNITFYQGEWDFIDLNNIFRHMIKCPVDVTVYDSSTDEIVGQIINNTVNTEIENGIEMYVNGNEKIFYTSSDHSYRIVLTGTNTGVMNYSLSEFDTEQGELERVNFYNIPLEAGLTYTGFESAYDFNLFDYTLNCSDNSIIEHNAYVQQNELNTVQISTCAIGNGTVSPSVQATEGDWISVTAIPDTNSTFKGWYKDELLVSTDLIYTFCVRENSELTAVFTDNQSDSETSENICKYCHQDHGSSFWGRIVAFFHSILYFFAHLFGKM